MSFCVEWWSSSSSCALQPALTVRTSHVAWSQLVVPAPQDKTAFGVWLLADNLDVTLYLNFIEQTTNASHPCFMTRNSYTWKWTCMEHKLRGSGGIVSFAPSNHAVRYGGAVAASPSSFWWVGGDQRRKGGVADDRVGSVSRSIQGRGLFDFIYNKVIIIKKKEWTNIIFNKL